MSYDPDEGTICGKEQHPFHTTECEDDEGGYRNCSYNRGLLGGPGKTHEHHGGFHSCYPKTPPRDTSSTPPWERNGTSNGWRRWLSG